MFLSKVALLLLPSQKVSTDTVMDGAIVELKTVSGNRTTLGKSFKKGYKQGLSMRETNTGIKTE
jgi:hypothetical protein